MTLLTNGRINQLQHKQLVLNNDTMTLEKNNKEIQIKGDPLLKWAGGKRSLLKKILPLIPKEFNRYYEPFFGGGALFFALQPKKTVLSDSNSELMNCYIQVRDNPEKVINCLKELRNSEQDYYKIRKRVPSCKVECAARMIYLTTLSFNGIYRLNRKGEFNVPYGRKTHLDPCDESKILLASKSLSRSQIRYLDFQQSVSAAKEGDLIYFDPPYTVSHNNNGFIKYNSKIFLWEDQIRLSKLAKKLVKKGCKVIISNANHPSIFELYEDFNCEIVERSSVIAASGKFRQKVSECIFYKGV